MNIKLKELISFDRPQEEDRHQQRTETAAFLGHEDPVQLNII